MSMLRKKVGDAANMAPYDKGTQNEDEMIEEVFIHSFKRERVAVRLQRIWRARDIWKPLKRQWKVFWGALNIQKWIRGIFGRRYAQLLKKMHPLAVVRIQRMFKNVKSNLIRRVWVRCTRRLTRRVLPKIKRFLKNCYLSWLVRHKAAAIIIQRCMRRYVFRERIYYHYGLRYLSWRPDIAATEIQRRLRGNWARHLIPYLLEARLVLMVDHPSARAVQRIFRGKIGRAIAKEKRKRKRAVIKIQKSVRRFLIRCWEIRHTYAVLLEKSATAIQKVYRGRMDRELYEFRYRAWWYTCRFLPAVLKVQTYGRMMVCKRDYLQLKLENRSAANIQLHWRASIKRAALKIQWAEAKRRARDLSVAKMQKIVRGYFGRKYYRHLSLSIAGKRILAAKTIIKAWVNFRNSKRYQALLDVHREKLYHKRLVKIRAARLEVEKDLEEVHKDKKLCLLQIDRCKKRVVELDVFHIEADTRINNLEKEIEACEPEDFERGWAEAFGNEYDCITAMRGHCLQEIRLWRNMILRHKRELLEFNCEIESTEKEIEELTVVELETIEMLRRWEIGRIEKKLNDRHRREMRHQRCRWKIQSNRASVIKRKGVNYKHVLEGTQSKRGIAYAATVTYEKRAQQWDYEQFVVDRFQKEQGLKLEAGMVRKYEDYGEPVQETYNNVVSNTLSLLQSWTADERARRVKQEIQAATKKKKMLRGGQFAALKTMDEPVGAFGYLEKK